MHAWSFEKRSCKDGMGTTVLLPCTGGVQSARCGWLAPGLLALTLGVAVSCNRQPAPPQADVGKQVADAFLDQIRRGQLDAAWQSTTAEFKSYQGRDTFRAQVAQHPHLRGPLQFVRYEVAQLNDLTRGQCIYQPASGKPPGRQVRVVVAQEGGQWKVDGLLLD